jgi:GT2 family glycosyltransferase
MIKANISAFIPVYNHFEFIEDVLTSLSLQEIKFSKILIVDDGSTKCFDLGILKRFHNLNIFYIKNKHNKGRGYCRYLAINKLDSDFILMLDSSNCLPKKFVKTALSLFESNQFSAASGLINNDPSVVNFVSKWRGRHLFKQNYDFGTSVHEAKSLTTYGTILRRSAVLDVGNFNRELVHSEDKELGDRLLNAGYKIIGDPKLIVYSLKKDTALSVLERYWRWYGGKDEKFTLKDYWHAIKASFRPMMQEDFKAKEWSSALISFLCPHYGFLRYFYRNLSGKIQKTC